jgi:riboflavin synthase
MGGNVVQGHVDGVGSVRAVDDDAIWVDAPAGLLRYVVEKGSIAVDGVSLTVAELDEEGFRVALIPHTREVTTLGALAPDDRVNLEVDVLAKYVERLVARA